MNLFLICIKNSILWLFFFILKDVLSLFFNAFFSAILMDKIIFRLLIHTSNGLLDPQVIQFCEKHYSQGNRSPHLLAYLIDVANENGEVYPKKPETGVLLKRAMKVNLFILYW